MKVFLLYPDRDFDLSWELPPNATDLSQDLALDALFAAMAQGDQFLLEVARRVVLSGSDELDIILYRQEILKDCLKHPDIIRQIYSIPLEFLERKRKEWLWISPRHAGPSSILSGAQRMLEVSLYLLQRLRQIADEHAGAFASRGFRRFFSMIEQELDDAYLATVARHTQALRFAKGVLLSAQLGNGNEGTQYILCKPNDPERSWIKRVFASKSPIYSFSLHPRDDHGAQVLGELRDRGLARAANSVAQAAEHIESFFKVLRWELAFYMGCLNLYEQLEQLDEPVAFPQVAPADERRFSCTGLYDISLALTMKRKVVGNDAAADGKNLVIITGPNQGGKTTFLRSVGLAQLMMQAGMFVPAESFSANLCSGLFTHFKREEDKTMERGKFEEELKRMSAIVDLVKPNGLILLNESFASTNEREGSEIAKEVVSALLEAGTKISYVTHLYEFACRAYEQRVQNVLFLRAERLPDGRRTFKVKEGDPLETSYGVDLYTRIFTAEGHRA
jgi:DNA mismatch repair protein MutS